MKTEPKTETATYKINVRRYFYGRSTVTELRDNDTGQPWRGTRAEAREIIQREECGRYYLASGEYTGATYRIARAL